MLSACKRNALYLMGNDPNMFVRYHWHPEAHQEPAASLMELSIVHTTQTPSLDGHYGIRDVYPQIFSRKPTEADSVRGTNAVMIILAHFQFYEDRAKDRLQILTGDLH